MKTTLEIGDKIKRFEVMLTKEYDYIYEIISVTKTLAKTKDMVFKRELVFGTNLPVSKNKIIAKVETKEKRPWSSPDYFLIETDK
jgi:tRNA A22 N-methylase